MVMVTKMKREEGIPGWKVLRLRGRREARGTVQGQPEQHGGQQGRDYV